MSTDEPVARPPSQPVAEQPVDDFGILGERHRCDLPDATIGTIWRCRECGQRWLHIGYERVVDVWQQITADHARRLLAPPSVPDDESPRRRWWQRTRGSAAPFSASTAHYTPVEE